MTAQLEVGDVVEQTLGICGLEVHDRIHCGGDVVLGDDFLGRNVDDLLPHVDLPQSVHEWHDDPQTGIDGLFVLAKPLNDTLLVGLDYPYAAGDDHQRNQSDQDHDANQNLHVCTSFRVFLTLVDRKR